MKKAFLLLLVILAYSCNIPQSGNETTLVQKKKTIYEMTPNERENIIRDSIVSYCNRTNDAVIIDYFMSFNKEYMNRSKPKDGAFSKLNILIDTIKNPYVEVSILLNSSRKMYNEHSKLGAVGLFTGIQFEIDSFSNVLGHKGYTQFEKDFLYYTEKDKFALSDLAK